MSMPVLFEARQALNYAVDKKAIIDTICLAGRRVRILTDSSYEASSLI